MSFVHQNVKKSSPDYFPVDGFEIPQLNTGSVHHHVRYVIDPKKDTDSFSSQYSHETHPEPWATETVKRLNNYNYRCDDFTDQHNGKHVLFLGCSVTWGDGLYEEELWSKKVYDTMSSMFSCSGYFNLSFPGLSTIEIIYIFEEYVRRFGKPDYLFINLPQLYRFFGVAASEKHDGSIDLSLCNTSDDRTTYAGSDVRINPHKMNLPAKMVVKYMTLKHIQLLEMLCKYSGIKLYMFTWDTSGEENLQDEIAEYETNSFIAIDKEDLMYRIHELETKSKSDFGWVARDGSHFGSYYHSAWSDILIDKVVEDMRKDV